MKGSFFIALSLISHWFLRISNFLTGVYTIEKLE
jgi:hypothetical protein